jgi:hypothetical protein
MGDVCVKPGAELQQAWDEFLGGLPWDWFVTLTFDPNRVYPVGQERAAREAVKWCETVAASLRRPVGWLVAVERSRSGQWHAHVLLIGTLGPIDAAVGLWQVRNGRVDVRLVTQASGAVLYASKDAYQTGAIYVSDTLGLYLASTMKGETVRLHPAQQD